MNKFSYFFSILFLFSLISCDKSEKQTVELIEWSNITISNVYPEIILPSSKLQITGGPFPDDSFGIINIVIDGVFQHDSEVESVFVSTVAKRLTAQTLELQITPELFRSLQNNQTTSGTLSARMTVEAVSSRTGNNYTSSEYSLNLRMETSLTPRLHSVTSSGFAHFESPVEFDGENLLLGESEGYSAAVLTGCFLPSSATNCDTDGINFENIEVPISDLSNITREGGTFSFPSSIFGVHPGSFSGSIKLRNIFDTNSFTESDSQNIDFELVETEISNVETLETSLGGYIFINGEGFVPSDDICSTVLMFNGDFTSFDSSESTPIDTILIPNVISGTKLSYVLEENNGLGEYLDMRKANGTFSGNISPKVCCGNDCLQGNSIGISVKIGPVKQVIELIYQDSFVSALAMFGLSGASVKITQKAKNVIDLIYRSINLEIRTEKITDYALYSRVEVYGFDSNGLGLLGYDNTAGKDVGNERLYDVIGGVNAITQEDGFPGYGGVFLESFFGFSTHPPEGIKSIDLADPLFDQIFDEFRPDRGGNPVTASEINAFIPISNPEICLSPSTRSEKLSCAVYVLGNMLGGTIAHEIGHSLGLAEPGSPDIYHNLGDKPYRLMDSGGNRPFDERSGLFISPDETEVFCISNYQYLHSIMPDPNVTDPLSNRPGC